MYNQIMKARTDKQHPPLWQVLLLSLLEQALERNISVDDPVFHVQVADGQPAEFRDPHAGMEEDKDRFVVFAEDIVIVDELEELPHLQQP